MLSKILNFFKPYQGSSDTFIEVSKTIKDEFAKQTINLPRIMSLLTVLESLAVTQGDGDIIKRYGDIIKRYKTQFRTKLDRMK